MEFDLMAGACMWRRSAELAVQTEKVGFSGIVYTEASKCK